MAREMFAACTDIFEHFVFMFFSSVFLGLFYHICQGKATTLFSSP